jgi:hypothetical protein
MFPKPYRNWGLFVFPQSDGIKQNTGIVVHEGASCYQYHRLRILGGVGCKAGYIPLGFLRATEEGRQGAWEFSTEPDPHLAACQAVENNPYYVVSA